MALGRALALGAATLLLIALVYYAYQAITFTEQLARLAHGALR
jgi:hypothetical protein